MNQKNNIKEDVIKLNIFVQFMSSGLLLLIDPDLTISDVINWSIFVQFILDSVAIWLSLGTLS